MVTSRPTENMIIKHAGHMEAGGGAAEGRIT